MKPSFIGCWSPGAWLSSSLQARTISGAELARPTAEGHKCACVAPQASAATFPGDAHPSNGLALAPEAEMVGGPCPAPEAILEAPEAAPRRTERKCSAAASRTSGAPARPPDGSPSRGLRDRSRQLSRQVREGVGGRRRLLLPGRGDARPRAGRAGRAELGGGGLGRGMSGS